MASSRGNERRLVGSKPRDARRRDARPRDAWTVAEAKAKLSEILRLARAGRPQTIGTEDACVVVSAAQFTESTQSGHLGRFLIESAPRGFELELPSRSHDRGNPFADDDAGL